MGAEVRTATQATALAAFFEAHGEPLAVRRRTCLHHAGESIASAWLVKSGWVGRVRVSPAGTESFTGIFIAGDVFGLDALADPPARDELTALSDCKLVRLSLGEVRTCLRGGGDAALEIAERLAADASFLREAVQAIGGQASVQRMSTFILQTRDRLVRAGLPAGAAEFELPLTQAQLGAVTGLTSVHVNRVLRLLREAALIDVRGGVARVLDLAGLRRTALSGR